MYAQYQGHVQLQLPQNGGARIGGGMSIITSQGLSEVFSPTKVQSNPCQKPAIIFLQRSNSSSAVKAPHYGSFYQEQNGLELKVYLSSGIDNSSSHILVYYGQLHAIGAFYQEQNCFELKVYLSSGQQPHGYLASKAKAKKGL